MRGRHRLAAPLAVIGAALALAAPASAQDEILTPASYPDMSTFKCRTDPITIYPGQNLNLFGITQTCPHAEKVSGPGSVTDFAPGRVRRATSPASSPAWSRLHPDGSLTTPSVWDLHLHHVVWLDFQPGGGRTFASGEEKTIPMMPQGYGYRTMRRLELGPQLHDPQPQRLGRPPGLHHLGDRLGAASSPSCAGMNRAQIQWLDVAGAADLSGVRRRARLRPRRRRRVRVPGRRARRPGGAGP